jgi:hypothetical protein
MKPIPHKGEHVESISPRTRQLVQAIFPDEAEAVGRILAEQRGRNLPFCQDSDEYQLERVRFATLKMFEKAVDMAKQDWRDELVWAGFAQTLTAHVEWAAEMLGPE